MADEMADTATRVTRTAARPPAASAASAPAEPVEPEETVAGLPVFDDTDEEAADLPDPVADEDWYVPRADVPAPPPPLEPPPERPLFAPAPTDGEPPRRTRTTAATASPSGDPGSPAYWPFDAEPEEPPVPGRRWLRLGVGLAVLVLLVVAGIIAVQLNGDSGDDPGRDTPASPTATSSPSSGAARPITGTTATDFDPFGDPPAENSDLAPRAVDGDPATSWRTSTYRQNLGPGGIKSGVGLVVDLQGTEQVSEVDLTFARAGTVAEIYVGQDSPGTADDLTRPAATVTAGRTAQVVLDQAATGRYVTIWLTSLPQVPGGFRTVLAEVSVLGTPA